MPLIGPPKPRLPVGISNLRDIRRGGYTYVDKTAFIAHVIDAPAVSLLFPRPRRFGKTLGMSTLRYFFEAGGDDTSDLFEGTLSGMPTTNDTSSSNSPSTRSCS